MTGPRGLGLAGCALAFTACAGAAPQSAPASAAAIPPAPERAPPPPRSDSNRQLLILPAPPAGEVPLTASGFGRLAIGAKLADVEDQYGRATTMVRHFDDGCRLYTGHLPGLIAYVQNGVVTRISISHVRLSGFVWIPPAVRTDRGIGIGSTQAEVRAAYAPLENRRQRAPGPAFYFAGENGNGLQFEFRDGKVSEISAGIPSALELNEGCL
jgi:hypothetical protein